MNNDSYIKVDYKDKELYLVKTAHVSKNSVEDVKEVIENVNPDAICIELDEDRMSSITKKDNWRDTDIVSIIKQKKVGFLMVNLILAAFQRRMAASLDTKSGGEMMAAIDIAKERNLPLVLADRKIKTTFSRIWNNLGFMEKAKLLTSIVMSIFDDEELTEEDLNNLKQADMLDAALAEVGKEFPMVKRILVDERDMYLAKKIRTAPGKKIVAVVGAAHANGIVRHLEEDINLDALNDLTKKKSYVGTILKWGIPLFIIGIILYTLLTNLDAGFDQIKSWILWNGTLTAIGTAICFAHPLTILVAFFAAPFTSLNPLLAAGWFAGLMEAHVRKPKVKDFEDMALDTMTIKGFWKNRVTRILLIVIMANIFSTLATVISGLDIFNTFLGNI